PASGLAVRGSGPESSTMSWREPGIGGVTESGSGWASCGRREGMAFIGIVLWWADEAAARNPWEGISPGHSGLEAPPTKPAKLPYAGLNRIRFEGSVSTAPARRAWRRGTPASRAFDHGGGPAASIGRDRPIPAGMGIGWRAGCWTG